MYLITVSHGEYDDFVSVPVFAVKDLTAANLIAEDIDDNPQSIYRDKIRKIFGMREDELFDWYASVSEVEEISLE
jgi:hypothetical protein